MIFLIASACILAPQPVENAALFHTLAEKGIHLTFRPTPRHRLARQKGGIVLISDFEKKAPIFRKWLPMARFYPDKKMILQDSAP